MSSPLTSLSSLEDILDITPSSPNSPTPPVLSQADVDVLAVAQVGCRTHNVSVISDLYPIFKNFHSVIVQTANPACCYVEWLGEEYSR